jgi:hypothetical protein
LPAYGPTANEIKAQLKTLLTPVIGTSLTYKTLILDYRALAFAPDKPEDVTVLRSDLDTATTLGGEIIKRVNCLMIVEDGFTQELPPKDATRMQTVGKGRVTITRKFLLSTFYQFGKVAQGDPNTVPSENVHSAINEVIRRTINANPMLGFAALGAAGIAGPGAHVSHDGIQNPNPDVDHFAGTQVHVSVMPLTVRVIEAIG